MYNFLISKQSCLGCLVFVDKNKTKEKETGIWGILAAVFACIVSEWNYERLWTCPFNSLYVYVYMK